MQPVIASKADLMMRLAGGIRERLLLIITVCSIKCQNLVKMSIPDFQCVIFKCFPSFVGPKLKDILFNKR